MALPNKPSIKNVWATTGLKVEPSDTKVNTGWIVERPPHQFQNFLQNRSDQFLKHINEAGIPVWDAVTIYTAGKSYVQGSDGKLYKAITGGANQDPVANPTNWMLTLGESDFQEIVDQTEDNALAAANSATDAAASEATALATLSVFDDVPPVAPLSGRQWTSNLTGKKYEWIVDADGGQWVEMGPQTTYSATAFSESLAATDGATKVGTSEGTVQDALDGRPTSVALAAPAGSAVVGTQAAGAGAVVRTIKEKNDDWLDIRDYGAVPGQDIAAALNYVAALSLASGLAVTGCGEYLLSSAVDLRRVKFDLSDTTISFSDTGQIILGNVSTAGSGPFQKTGNWFNPLTSIPPQPTIVVKGSKGQRISVGFTNWLQIYTGVSASDNSTAYSTIDVERATRFSITGDPSAVAESWANENTINIKRCSEIVIEGPYGHNHNLIYGGTMEGATTIKFLCGNSNRVLSLRGENGPCVVTNATGTWDNTVEQTWSSNPLSPYLGQPGFTMLDSGIGNRAIIAASQEMDVYDIAAVNSGAVRTYTRNTVNHTSQVGVYAAVGGLLDMQFANNFIDVVDTDLIPVKRGIGFRFVSDVSGWRPFIYLYDLDGKLIKTPPSDTSLLYRSPTLLPVSGDAYAAASNLSSTAWVVAADTVGFIRIVLKTGSSVIGNYYKDLHLTAIVPKHYRMARYTLPARQPAAASIPTMGYASIGERVASTVSAAATGWLCTFSRKTALSADLSTTSISVDVATGVVIGDVVGVQQSAGGAHWTTVASVSPLTLTASPPAPITSGALVCFVRWA